MPAIGVATLARGAHDALALVAAADARLCGAQHARRHQLQATVPVG